MKKRIKLIVVNIVILVATIGAAVFIMANAAQKRAQYEYYRGLYDACLYFTAVHLVGSPDYQGCNDMADKAFASHWFEQQTMGFDGPNLTVDQNRAR